MPHRHKKKTIKTINRPPDLEKWFDELYIEFYPILMKTALHNTKDPHLAEDMVQNTFETLYEKREELCTHPKIDGWLTAAVKFKIFSDKQLRKYMRELPLDEGARLTTEMDITTFQEMLPDSLTETDRLILDLYYRHGYNHTEIAEILGCSAAASRMRMHRAVAKCKNFAKNEKI